jgi:hypothetical protein
MKWCYFLSFSENAGTHAEMKKFIDSCPDILNWYYCMSNTFFIISERTASRLADIILTFTKKKGRFFIIDANSDRSGWLPPEAWKFIKKSDEPVT